jgi:hypothetical protein
MSINNSSRLFCRGVPVSRMRCSVRRSCKAFDSFDSLLFSRWPSSTTCGCDQEYNTFFLRYNRRRKTEDGHEAACCGSEGVIDVLQLTALFNDLHMCPEFTDP